MKLSVIIPSYNRLPSLRLCLEHLSKQSLAKDLFEVLVIDDGSEEGYKEKVEKYFREYGLAGSYYYQDNAGPAKARNQGIKLSQGEVLLFIGDDMLADNNLLQKHYTFHLQNSNSNQALLGKVEWSNKIEINDFMQWLERTGFQFDFDSLSANRETDYNHFYTSNISLRKTFLLANGVFNESFPDAAFEDIELGYRLSKKSLKIIYDPSAIVYHHHQMTFATYLNRMDKNGRATQILIEIHPELESNYIIPMSPKRRIKKLLKTIILNLSFCPNKIINNKKITELYWQHKLLNQYFNGYKQAKKNIHHHS